MRKGICILAFYSLFFASCSFVKKVEEPPKEKPIESTKAAAEINTAKPVEANKANTPRTKESFDEIKVTKTDCTNIDAGDNAVLAKQTFPVDFAPFNNSCFVTTYNPEYDDPPLESEFAIYKDGAKVFDFPSRFNGVEFGCWVDAVAFEDLNDDNLEDVIVVGKCSAKSGPYNENVVYVNTGRDFTTDEEANSKLNDFKRIKEISDFVRRNRQIFFK
ncbi:MAG TPA: hypothetical protein VF556_19010 [Pyrinomonadaceae bacterium]|jgi:hypothetical protein